MIGVRLGHLAEGAIEHGHAVFDAEPQVRVGVKGQLGGRMNVGRLQGHGLVAVGSGDPDPAVPIAVFHIGPAEEDQAGFQRLGVDQKGHGGAAPCAGSVSPQRLSP